ncbi:hypothetical protein ACIQWA_33220 [Kitasatospora sp. NPDC098652]|uniref:hypothetical protein n=1 Tax=Kitasatospora sp. NPDC098652 TaxID=3364095 RepID=UPI00381CF4C1
MDQLVAALSRQAWERISGGSGAHGERISDWTRLAIRPTWHNGFGQRVRARRSVSDPAEMSSYVCFGSVGSRLKDLLSAAEAAGRAERGPPGGSGEEAVPGYAAVAADAERHGLAAEWGAALEGLGQCVLEAGELVGARGHFEAAEAVLAEGGVPPTHRVPAIRGRALTHFLAGELRYACYLLESRRIEAALDAYRTGLGHRSALGATTLGPAPAKPF